MPYQYVEFDAPEGLELEVNLYHIDDPDTPSAGSPFACGELSNNKGSYEFTYATFLGLEGLYKLQALDGSTTVAKSAVLIGGIGGSDRNIASVALLGSIARLQSPDGSLQSAASFPGDFGGMVVDENGNVRARDSSGNAISPATTTTAAAIRAALGFASANADTQLAGLLTAANSIQNNTSCVRNVPNTLLIPDSGTITYRIELLLYDESGNMEAPDSAPTIALVNQSGTDRSARLSSTAMSLVSTGFYRVTYTSTSTDPTEQLNWAFSVVEGGATRIYSNNSQVIDVDTVAAIAALQTTANATNNAYMWQALETKARFITQLMSGASALRRTDDIGSQELSYAEVKAIASGNPAVLTLAETDAELQRLAILKKNHLDEQYVARRKTRDLPAAITRMAERLSKLETDQNTIASQGTDRINIGGRTYPKSEVQSALADQLAILPQSVGQMQHFPLGTYRGLTFGLTLNPSFSPEVTFSGAATRCETLSRDHHGPRAIMNALERLVGSYGAECARARQDHALAEEHLRDYQARLGRSFTEDEYLSQLAVLRDELKAALSGKTQEPGKETGPCASELADRIKALRAERTIEAVTERVPHKQATAEEPVTTRIRRMPAATAESSMIEPRTESSRSDTSLHVKSADYSESNISSTDEVDAGRESTIAPRTKFLERALTKRGNREPSLP